MFSTFILNAKTEQHCYASFLIRMNDAYNLLTRDEKESYDKHGGKVSVNSEYLFQIIDTDDGGFVCRRSNIDMNDICIRLGLYDD
jgi:hypothetical protein